MHSIVTTFRGADIKVEVANFCAAMDALIDQDVGTPTYKLVKLYSSFVPTTYSTCILELIHWNM